MNWSELKHIITQIDWQQFHFLRPKALLLFYVLLAIVLLLILGNRERKKWKHSIAADLRPFMFNRGSSWALVFPLLLFVLGMSCAIIGLAGPTWKKVDIPGEKVQAVVLIALDLSRSMDAKDIQPSRLERAKFKISDLLDQNPRARAGLIAFAGTPHPVLPFTSDYKLVKYQAKSLESRVMPVPGSNIHLLMQIVDTMMRPVSAPSTVLLMTDAIQADDVPELLNWVNGSVHRLEILLFSTPNGAEVPGHTKVISRQDPVVMQNLSNDPKVTITTITLDKSDVEGVAKRVRDKLVFEKEKKASDKDWDDMGWLLLIPALLITAWWFRRGWVIAWCWLPLALMVSSCGVNSKHPDWWYSKDYQGQLLANAGNYAEAAERFEEDQHKAVAYFKAGDYEAAAELFSLDTTDAGKYNRGLALAKLGRYQEALDAFDQVTSLGPGMKEKIEAARSQTRLMKLEADSVQRFGPEKDLKDISSGKDKDKSKKDPLKERKPESEDEKLSSDTRVKKLPTSGNRVTDEAESGIRKAKEAKFPPKDFKLDKNQKLATNILLRRAAADPGEFLHRRFELQQKKYYKEVKPGKEPW